MTVRLSKIFTQRFGNEDTHLEICVDFDTTEKAVVCVNYIRAINRQVFTDISHILFNNFHDEADQMVDSINWWEVYRTTENIAA